MKYTRDWAANICDSKSMCDMFRLCSTQQIPISLALTVMVWVGFDKQLIDPNDENWNITTMVKQINRRSSNISHTLVGNKIADHSNVVGASPVGAPTTSSFST